MAEAKLDDLIIFARRFLEEVDPIMEYVENSTPNSDDLTGNAVDVLADLRGSAQIALGEGGNHGG